ncbi:MAG: hypothetical protein JSR81_13010 [Proteobacteria bacterium]|nr:hypothetical protein [Pseudomonadota bacterium]
MFVKGAECFGKTSEGILHDVASALFLHHPTHAQEQPSMLRRPLQQKLRPSMHVFDDCDGIG